MKDIETIIEQLHSENRKRRAAEQDKGYKSNGVVHWRYAAAIAVVAVLFAVVMLLRQKETSVAPVLAQLSTTEDYGDAFMSLPIDQVYPFDSNKAANEPTGIRYKTVAYTYSETPSGVRVFCENK